MRNTRNILMSTAALLLALVPGLAAAEMLSTPSEQAQTRALNAGSQGGIYTSPNALNGGPSDSQSVPSNQANSSPGHDAWAPFHSSADEGAGPAGTLNPNNFITLKTANPQAVDMAPVFVASGQTVGRVQVVSLAPDGTPARVEIVLTDGQSVWVSPNALRYNPTAHLALTNLNQSDLNAMAARQAGHAALD